MALTEAHVPELMFLPPSLLGGHCHIVQKLSRSLQNTLFSFLSSVTLSLLGFCAFLPNHKTKRMLSFCFLSHFFKRICVCDLQRKAVCCYLARKRKNGTNKPSCLTQLLDTTVKLETRSIRPGTAFKSVCPYVRTGRHCQIHIERERRNRLRSRRKREACPPSSCLGVNPIHTHKYLTYKHAHLHAHIPTSPSEMGRRRKIVT